MTRYQKIWRSKDASIVDDVMRAMKRYNTDKEKLDADSVNFQSIDDMDIGEHYIVSYNMPIILPISEILWINSKKAFGRIYIFARVSDGHAQLLFVKDEKNIDTIVKMLCARNKNLIYGDNKDLETLFQNDFEEFKQLISLHPNEDAANIKAAPALLPAPEPKEESKPQIKAVKAPSKLETPYIPPKKQALDSVVIPENAPFAEEMNLLISLAKKYPDYVSLQFYEPVSANDIEEFETRNNVKLTDELKTLFLFTNGFDLSAGHFAINSLEFIERYISTEWEWGDIKHYLYIGDRIGDGEVILLNRDNGNIITNDHGEETDFVDLTTLLSDNIWIFLEGEFEDDELNAYISKIKSYMD